MKICVLLEVTKPLKRMKNIKRPRGESSIIKFKYEWLGNFCYFYGMLGHIEDYCEKLYSLSTDDGIRIWGPELRVEKQHNNGGGANKLRDEGITITAPTSVTVSKSNGQNAESGAANIPNFRALMSLLQNPNLICNSSAVNAAIANSIPHTNDDQLMENNEAVITNKTKRSREIITDEGRIESSTTIAESNVHSATTTSGANHPSSNLCACTSLSDKTFFIGRARNSGLPGTMNIISWNCRGLGNVKAVPSLKDLIRVYKSDIVILIETLVDSNKISDLCYILGFENHFSVDQIGQSGGLAILWRNNINCSLLNYSQNFINMAISDPIKGN